MFPELESSRTRRTVTATQRVLRALHLDGPLLAGIALLAGMGLFVLYSAVGENLGLWTNQAIRLAIAVVVMVTLAQVPPRWLRLFAPAGFVAGVLLLVAVALVGDVSMGAQRWLDLGVVRFQPSEMLKVAVPMMVAWYGKAVLGTRGKEKFEKAAFFTPPPGTLDKDIHVTAAGTLVLPLDSPYRLFVVDAFLDVRVSPRTDSRDSSPPD